jgi:signal transduction histidine kinase
MCDQVNHLTDEQEWGICESIEPQKFIEYYEQSHANPKFKFKHLWDNFETNCFSKDILDKKTGKVLFYKGESLNTAWFPKKALLQVFDNIVSNACEHGFKDKNRIDYIIQTEWETNGFNMIIKISNNGEPISSDLNTDLIFEYGYSSVLNHNGHNGIGGGEIAEIMHKFGGDVNVISTPNKRFTVTYILTIPLASIY